MRHNGYSLHFLARLEDSDWFHIAGLILCRAEGGDHSNDTVTDMLFLGILPAEIDRDFTDTLQHFLSATKMTWDQLDEHYHNLCDTNRTWPRSCHSNQKTLRARHARCIRQSLSVW